MTGADLAFAVFALVTIAAAVLAVAGRQVVHAALWLVVALAGLAGIYLVLGAEVVALVQVLVYVGAVIVLLLFALMLTRAPIGPKDDLDASPRRRWAAAATGAAVSVLVGGTLLAAVGGRTVDIVPAHGGPAAVGTAIFAGWLLPFELLSLLLLAALVGALAVSGATRGTEGLSWTAGRRVAASVRRTAAHATAHPASGAGEHPVPGPGEHVAHATHREPDSPVDRPASTRGDHGKESSP